MYALSGGGEGCPQRAEEGVESLTTDNINAENQRPVLCKNGKHS